MRDSNEISVRPGGTGPLLRLIGASKTYGQGEAAVQALRPTDLEIFPGEIIAILGPSGSGKSTLLNLVGAMDRPSGGQVLVNLTGEARNGGSNNAGQSGEDRSIDLASCSEADLTRFRRFGVGFVFQFFNLVPNLNTLENVALAAEIGGHPDPLAAALVALERVGLADRTGYFPSQLSGGQQQRAAIARALVKNPPLILADEPTGALDHTSGVMALGCLWEANRGGGQTVMIVTHNQPIARMAHRVLNVYDGRIRSIEVNPDPEDPAGIDW